MADGAGVQQHEPDVTTVRLRQKEPWRRFKQSCKEYGKINVMDLPKRVKVALMGSIYVWYQWNSGGEEQTGEFMVYIFVCADGSRSREEDAADNDTRRQALPEANNENPAKLCRGMTLTLSEAQVLAKCVFVIKKIQGMRNGDETTISLSVDDRPHRGCCLTFGKDSFGKQILVLTQSYEENGEQVERGGLSRLSFTLERFKNLMVVLPKMVERLAIEERGKNKGKNYEEIRAGVTNIIDNRGADVIFKILKDNKEIHQHIEEESDEALVQMATDAINSDTCSYIADILSSEKINPDLGRMTLGSVKQLFRAHLSNKQVQSGPIETAIEKLKAMPKPKKRATKRKQPTRQNSETIESPKQGKNKGKQTDKASSSIPTIMIDHEEEEEEESE